MKLVFQTIGEKYLVNSTQQWTSQEKVDSLKKTQSTFFVYMISIIKIFYLINQS